MPLSVCSGQLPLPDICQGSNSGRVLPLRWLDRCPRFLATAVLLLCSLGKRFIALHPPQTQAATNRPWDSRLGLGRIGPDGASCQQLAFHSRGGEGFATHSLVTVQMRCACLEFIARRAAAGARRAAAKGKEQRHFAAKHRRPLSLLNTLPPDRMRCARRMRGKAPPHTAREQNPALTVHG
jgi:hypothetical protein